jgi:hypothetical protein
VHPGQQLHDGGLARAVLADEGVHLSAAQREGDLRRRDHRPEGLGDLVEPENGRAGGRVVAVMVVVGHGAPHCETIQEPAR